MAAQTLTREQAVSAAIREISHIATLPEITLKIIQLVESPTSTAQDLHNVISKDPALCTRILKVVNSAFYGLPGQIGSINRAIVLLGLNAVKNIAIAASLAKLFKGGSLTPTFTAKDLWTHAVAVGAASRMLAQQMKLGLTDEAFLAGLLHDVGVMVELQFDRNKLVEVVERCEAASASPIDMMTVEDEIFGANHQDFGAGLCEKWKFPRSFIGVCGYHHRPLELPADNRALACIVAVADRIAGAQKSGFRLDQMTSDIPQEWIDELKVTREDIEAIKAKLPDAVADVERMMT
ncbi:MAG: HDOD domain-containing protein [Phycisphaerales bacterium]